MSYRSRLCGLEIDGNVENFECQQPVKTEDRVVSFTADGRVSFVYAEDIAAVAAVALTRKDCINVDLLILGPKLYGIRM